MLEPAAGAPNRTIWTAARQPRLSLVRQLQYVTISTPLDLKLMSQRARRREADIFSGDFSLRSLMTFVLALGVFLQGYITQTHIHVSPAERAGILHVSSDGAHHKQPIDDDSAHCPLCQTAVMSGNFITPTAPALPVPLALPVTMAMSFVIALRDTRRAYNWQSRAPPRI